MIWLITSKSLRDNKVAFEEKKKKISIFNKLAFRHLYRESVVSVYDNLCNTAES